MVAIADHLRRCGVHFELLWHVPAGGAARLAHALHLPGRFVAKGVLVASDSAAYLAVLPATHQIDLARLAEALGAPEVRIASEQEVREIFADCEPGAVPPLGQPYGLTTIVDTSLSGVADMVVESNLRHLGIRLRYRDYEAIERPLRGRFAVIKSPPRHRLPRRQAS